MYCCPRQRWMFGKTRRVYWDSAAKHNFRSCFASAFSSRNLVKVCCQRAHGRKLADCHTVVFTKTCLSLKASKSSPLTTQHASPRTGFGRHDCVLVLIGFWKWRPFSLPLGTYLKSEPVILCSSRGEDLTDNVVADEFTDTHTLTQQEWNHLQRERWGRKEGDINMILNAVLDTPWSNYNTLSQKWLRA